MELSKDNTNYIQLIENNNLSAHKENSTVVMNSWTEKILQMKSFGDHVFC